MGAKERQPLVLTRGGSPLLPMSYTANPHRGSWEVFRFSASNISMRLNRILISTASDFQRHVTSRPVLSCPILSTGQCFAAPDVENLCMARRLFIGI